MSEPSREEFDAKLQLVEARMELRLADISSKLDRVGDRLQSAAEQSTSQIKSVLDRVDVLTGAVREVKDDNKNTRWTIIVTVVAAVLAGLAALWTTQGNMLSAMQTGAAFRPTMSSESPGTRLDERPKTEPEKSAPK